jgi:hypothetical protein
LKLTQIDTPVVKVEERMAVIFKELAIYQNSKGAGIFAEESVWVEVGESNAPF